MTTHTDGERVRYFADDDKYSLQEMVRLNEIIKREMQR